MKNKHRPSCVSAGMLVTGQGRGTDTDDEAEERSLSSGPVIRIGQEGKVESIRQADAFQYHTEKQKDAKSRTA